MTIFLSILAARIRLDPAMSREHDDRDHAKRKPLDNVMSRSVREFRQRLSRRDPAVLNGSVKSGVSWMWVSHRIWQILKAFFKTETLLP